ncbi:MAG: Fpg/Nei family DNA glycosylase [bacterium]
MPELPEVESRRIIIEKAFKGRILVSFDILKKGIVKHADKKVIEGIRNKRLLSVGRKGKYLIFNFTDDLGFILHFGLFGEMQITSTDKEFTSVCARMDYDNKKSLFLLKWASLWFGMGLEDLEKLGPDPISEPERFTLDYLSNALLKKKTKIKPFLMEQDIIAGIGAVYADEILFKSGILPTRPANDLNKDEVLRLYNAIKSTLKNAIDKTIAAGSEDRPFLSLENKKACPVCGTEIVNTRLAGRRTLYCPSCQH